MSLRVGCRADDSDKHGFDVNFILYHKGKLYTAGDDGKIIAWASDLKKLAEVQSNPCSVYCLANDNDTLFSCSNEGTIKSFDLQTLKKKAEITRDKSLEIWSLVFHDGCLFSGDSEGNVKIYKNNTFYGALNIEEPIKDMAIHKNLLFTVKDLYVFLTDIKVTGEQLEYNPINTFMGRAPLTLIGDKLFCFLSREGKDIIIHEMSNESHYKYLTSVQGAHEQIINALAGVKWNNKYILFSGGWDRKVKKWIIDEDIVKMDSSCNVDIVVNAITIGDKGEIYVGGSDGHVVRIEIE